MKKTHILAAAAVVALGACSRITSAPIDARVDQTVDLATGEAARVENSSVIVRFTGANDSRCPSDVVCVTAGDAAISLLLSGSGADRVSVVYLTAGASTATRPASTVYGAYRFEAVALVPYPKSTVTNPDRTVTLRITRAP